MSDFAQSGWQVFGPDDQIAQWAAHALPHARRALRDPANAHWHVCGGTWFVGVDALPNDPAGAIGGSGPLRGPVIAAVAALTGPLPPLHRAQVSVVWPGYPQPRAGESAGAFRYRQKRDAAHVDGLRAEGPERRRFLREPHGFILGLPLTQAHADAAPLVVWEGSHRIMGAAFQAALAGHAPQEWGDVDLTEIYQAARAEVFDICRRVPIVAQPGQAVLVHRLTLHGVAPWNIDEAPDVPAGPDGRMIAYFRPELRDGDARWPLIDQN